MAEENKVQGWKDVQITPDMPLTVLVHFLNVLNQRLVTIEDNLKIGDKSLTQIYAEQAEKERKEMAETEMAKPQAEEKKEA